VAGIYRDYGAESGALLLDLATFADLFGEGPPQSTALLLAPGADAEAMAARVRAAFPDSSLQARSQRALRADVLAVFEETFAVTRLLQGMGLVIAVAGVALSLVVLGRERAAETALLRSLGASRTQVLLVFVGRGLGIALLGLGLGAAGGTGLAWVLVEIVNPAWFGWSLDLSLPLRTLGLQGATILGAAALAALPPALRASRTQARDLSRDAL
jgi:putative ABC transport system permease protein